MRAVEIRFARGRAFAACLLAYPLYVNGEPVGAVKNGGALIARVPEAPAYIVGAREPCCIGRHAEIEWNGERAFSVELRTRGGWREPAFVSFSRRFPDGRSEALERDPVARALEGGQDDLRPLAELLETPEPDDAAERLAASPNARAAMEAVGMGGLVGRLADGALSRADWRCETDAMYRALVRRLLAR